MILIQRQKAKYIQYICQGNLERLNANEALAKMLTCMEKKDYAPFNDNNIFVKGLKSNFNSEGFMDGDEITSVGREIINSGKVWTPLYGTHLLSAIECRDCSYIIQHAPDYQGKYSFDNCPSNVFVGEFKCNGMQIREIRLDKKALKAEEKPVDLECSYDFLTDKSS